MRARLVRSNVLQNGFNRILLDAFAKRCSRHRLFSFRRALSSRKTKPEKPFDLTALRSTDLRSILASIGSQQSGNKGEVLTRLERDLQNLSLYESAIEDGVHSLRVLSIDMGIRNFAYCVATIDVSPAPQRLKSTAEPLVPTLTVQTWRKLSLPTLSLSSTSSPPATAPKFFTTPSLASLAHTLATSHILPHAPDLILIERQRHRTLGSAAVQEWTYRVNMLEGMLWAILETLSHLPHPSSPPPLVASVDPARVRAMWVRERPATEKTTRNDTAAADTTKPRRKIRPRGAPNPADKRHRVAVLARAIDADTGLLSPLLLGPDPRPDTPAGAPALARVAFEAHALRTRDAFARATTGRAEARRARRRRARRGVAAGDAEGSRDGEKGGKGEGEGEEGEGEVSADLAKVDDVADCLLQAAAWAVWEGNRRAARAAVLRGADPTGA